MERRSTYAMALLCAVSLGGILWLAPWRPHSGASVARQVSGDDAQRKVVESNAETVETLGAKKPVSPTPRHRVSPDAITDMTFKAALDNRPALPAESTLLQAGKINAESARHIFETRSFDSLVDAIDKDMRADPFSLEIAEMFEGALADSFAAEGLVVDRLACGRALCAGSAIPQRSDASWNAATAAFDRMYGATYSSLVTSFRYVNGQLVHDFILSTNPAQPSIFFSRMPAAGINFGLAPEAPPAPGG